MNILEEIIQKRKDDIERLGFTMGVNVPEKRPRSAPIPLVQRKGVILEIKRASPSKGDIAPSLNARDTALSYIKANAVALSVLTEKNYFKGSLQDLVDAANAVDNASYAEGECKPAILRKDFLIDVNDVDIAYRCGADAILLIARVLDIDILCAMAKRCKELGMTALLELRTMQDVEKLSVLLNNLKDFNIENNIVCGVNARDLADFTIDLLQPAIMLNAIRKHTDLKIIFESGIRTVHAANFVGSMGFNALLLGEAAARNPQDAKCLVDAFVNSKNSANAKSWLNYSTELYKKNVLPQDSCAHNSHKKRPFLKICGLTSVDDALYAALGGADFLGFIFSAKSVRNVKPQIIKQVKEILNEQFNQTCQDEHIFAAGQEEIAPFLVGVITECDSAEAKVALALAREGVLDFIQLHGTTAIKQFFNDDSLMDIPHYAAVNVVSEEDLSLIDDLCQKGEPRVLIDSKTEKLIGGTGVTVDKNLVIKVKNKVKLWLAGGITPENVKSIVQETEPELIDVSSGVEEKPGIKDSSAILDLDRALEEVG